MGLKKVVFTPSLPDQAEEDAGSGGEDVAVGGRDTKRGHPDAMEAVAGDGRDHPDAESGEEADAGSAGEVVGVSMSERPSVRNMWCEPMLCSVCESSDLGSDGSCKDCGLWQPQFLSLEDSENQARALLNQPGELKRQDIDRLLAQSLKGSDFKSRACDRIAATDQTAGWSLGFYVYGAQVGITKETLKRPFLTQVLNKYLLQELPGKTWAAIRVTSDLISGPHKDRNQKRSSNHVVPLSDFQGGRIWVEGVPNAECELHTKTVQGIPCQGYFIGGSQQVCTFDPSAWHAVEPAVGYRRVLVGYTPRLLERLSLNLRQQLSSLSFPLPRCNQEQEQTPTQLAPEEDTQGDRQGDRGEEDGRSGVSPGGEGSNWVPEMELDGETELGCRSEEDHFLEELHDQYTALGRIEMDSRKYFDEELEAATEQGWVASVDHLIELKDWVHELETWIIVRDASSKLRSQVGTSEATILKARLRKFGVDPQEPEVVGYEYDEWVPLSGLPITEPEGESGDSEAVKPPGPKASEAVPAAPLQTVSVSHREVLEKVEEWRPSISGELESVFERHGALHRTSKEEVEQWIRQGKTAEFLPQDQNSGVRELR